MKQARGTSIPRYQVCYLTPSSRGEILGWKSTKIMKILKNQWLLHQIQWFSWKSVTNKIFCVRFVHNLQSSVINIFWWSLFCSNRMQLPYDVTFCVFRFEFLFSRWLWLSLFHCYEYFLVLVSKGSLSGAFSAICKQICAIPVCFGAGAV